MAKKKKKEVNVKLVFGVWSMVLFAGFFLIGGILLGSITTHFQQIITVYWLMVVGIVMGIMIGHADKKERECSSKR